MSDQESPLGEALRVLTEKGVLQRNQASDILENHGWLVSVGELPELDRGKLHEKLVPAPDHSGSNVAGISALQNPEYVPEAPASLGSALELKGTLSVDRSNEEAEPLTEFDLIEGDDEPTTVGTKRGKKK